MELKFNKETALWSVQFVLMTIGATVLIIQLLTYPITKDLVSHDLSHVSDVAGNSTTIYIEEQNKTRAKYDWMEDRSGCVISMPGYVTIDAMRRDFEKCISLHKILHPSPLSLRKELDKNLNKITKLNKVEW